MHFEGDIGYTVGMPNNAQRRDARKPKPRLVDRFRRSDAARNFGRRVEKSFKGALVTVGRA